MSPFGMALGAGGARGYCHIGVLQVMAQAGFAPSALSGSSIGALVAVAQASGKLQQLHDWAVSLTRLKYASLLDIRPFSGGLIGGRVIESIWADLDLPERFEDLDVPVACVATDLETGAELWFREGELFPAVRASMALPGVLSPVWHQGHWLCDGGMTNPVPVDLCQGLIHGPVIGVTPAARTNRTARTLGPGDTPGYVFTMQSSFEIIIESVRRARAAAHPPRLSIDCGALDLTAMDFHLAESAIAKGRATAERHLPELREIIAGPA